MAIIPTNPLSAPTGVPSKLPMTQQRSTVPPTLRQPGVGVTASSTSLPTQESTQEPKLTVDQFAAKIKASHPELNSVPSSKLVASVLKKHPEFSSRLTTTPEAWNKQSVAGGSWSGTNTSTNKQTVTSKAKTNDGFLATTEKNFRSENKIKDVGVSFAETFNPKPLIETVVRGIEHPEDSTLGTIATVAYTLSNPLKTTESVYNGVKQLVETKPAYAAGTVAGLVAQWALGKYALPKAIPSVPGASTIEPAATELKSVNGGKELTDTMTGFEKMKPGLIKSVGNFASQLPVTQKKLFAVTAARQEALGKVAAAIAGSYTDDLSENNKLVESVKSAAYAANQNRIEAGIASDKALTEQLTTLNPDVLDTSVQLLHSGDDTLDAKDVGEQLTTNIRAIEADYKNAVNELYNGLSTALDESKNIEGKPIMVKLADVRKSAVRLWRDNVPTRLENLSMISGSAKAVMSDLIPFDKLDAKALEYTKDTLTKAGVPADKLPKNVSFFKLDPKIQEQILNDYDFKLNVKPGDAIKIAKFITTNVNKISKTTGISKNVLLSINNELKSTMSEAFAAGDPALASQWEAAQKMSYAKAMRFRARAYQAILDDQRNPIAGEALVRTMIGNPTKAENVMKLIDRGLSSDKQLVKTGTEYTTKIRQYALQELDRIGKDDPSKALADLQSDQRGYKQILGKQDYTKVSESLQARVKAVDDIAAQQSRAKELAKLSQIGADNPEKALDALTQDNKEYKKVLGSGTPNSAYDKALAHWQQRVAEYKATDAGKLSDLASKLTGISEPAKLIQLLSDPDNENFTNHVLKLIGNNSELKADLGNKIFYNIADKANNLGHFGLEGSVTDPSKFANELTKAEPRLAQFLRPDQMRSIKNLAHVMSQSMLQNRQSMIGVYRTTEIVLGGYSMFMGSTAGLTVTAALIAMPKVLFAAATNPMWSDMLIKGFYLSPGTQEYLNWATKFNAATSVIAGTVGVTKADALQRYKQNIAASQAQASTQAQ